MDKFQSMEIFARVVDTNSFTKAADSLQVARPVITRAIQELEARLGVRLINRTTRRLNLTEEGRSYYEATVKILNAVDESESAFRLSTSVPRGTLKIDVQTAVAKYLVVPRLAEFREMHPQIELIVGIGDRPVDLVEEGVDCAIRVGALEDSTMIARRVGLFQRVTVASPEYLKRFGAPVDLDDLTMHRVVHYIAGKGVRPPLFEFVTPSGNTTVRMVGSVQVNDSHTYVELAKAGFGLIQAAEFALEDELRSGELVEVLKDFQVPVKPISLVFPQNRNLAPKLRAFVSWVSDVFANSPMAAKK